MKRNLSFTSLIVGLTMADYMAMAETNPFKITAEAKGKEANVRISGVIHKWNASSDWFKSKIEEFNTDGVEVINLNINTPGGSVFEANEIKNELDNFKGTVNGFGGAMVASAGTYIRMGCDTFQMPPNGQFMIHKPIGAIRGNEDEVESDLEVLRSLTQDYRAGYAELTNSSEDDIEKKWLGKDYWMDSKKALNEGFITSIGKKKESITKDTQALFVACAAPVVPKTTKTDTNINIMDTKVMALKLGLNENATEKEINAKLDEVNAAAAKVKEMEKAAKDKEKADHDANIENSLNTLIAEKKATTAQIENLRKFAQADFEAYKSHIATLEPLGKISASITGKMPSSTSASIADKAFDALTDDEEKELLENDPDAYKAKYEAYLEKKENN